MKGKSPGRETREKTSHTIQVSGDELTSTESGGWGVVGNVVEKKATKFSMTW